jgi:hypothetical protein
VKYEKILTAGPSQGDYKVWMATDRNGLATFSRVSSYALKQLVGLDDIGVEWIKDEWIQPLDYFAYEASKIPGLLKGTFRELMEEQECVVYLQL